MRISGHLCVYIQAVAPIVHQNLALNNMSFKILCFKTVREPLVLVALRGLLIDILIIKERSFKQKREQKFAFCFVVGKALWIVKKRKMLNLFFWFMAKKCPLLSDSIKHSIFFFGGGEEALNCYKSAKHGIFCVKCHR